MDHLHVATTLPLLEAGYDVLLEKPIGTSQEQVQQLLDTATRSNRKVMICHELRYAPFYAEIRKRLLEGVIGEIMNMQFVENVSYHHLTVGYVRGKWNGRQPGSSLHLIGTKGEIQGVLEDGCFTIRYPDLSARDGFREERVQVDVTDNMHGGGDMRLVSDFLRVMRGEQPSLSTTTLQDSVNGHFVGFGADRSRVEQGWIMID